MPIIRFYAKPIWLPSIDAAEAGRSQINFPLTKKLLEVLPSIVLAAVNEIDDTELTLAEVMLIPYRIHPWAINAPDMWILVSPDDIDGDDQARVARRVAIRDIVYEAVEAFIRGYCFERIATRPAYDVECSPLSGSGTSVNAEGKVVAQWGDFSSAASEPFTKG